MKTAYKTVCVVALMLGTIIGAVLTPAVHAATHTAYSSKTQTEQLHTIHQSLNDLEEYIAVSTMIPELEYADKIALVQRLSYSVTLMLLFKPSTNAERYILSEQITRAKELLKQILLLVQKPNIQAQELAQEVYHEVNRVRNEHDAQSIPWNNAIAFAALQHSTDMKNNNYFSHTNLQEQKPIERFGGIEKLVDKTGCTTRYSENLGRMTVNREYYTIGENGVVSIKSKIIAQEIVKLWMQSKKGHRENMLMKTHRLNGIGVAISERDKYRRYKIYITQNFCS